MFLLIPYFYGMVVNIFDQNVINLDKNLVFDVPLKDFERPTLKNVMKWDLGGVWPKYIRLKLYFTYSLWVFVAIHQNYRLLTEKDDFWWTTVFLNFVCVCSCRCTCTYMILVMSMSGADTSLFLNLLWSFLPGNFFTDHYGWARLDRGLSMCYNEIWIIWYKNMLFLEYPLGDLLVSILGAFPSAGVRTSLWTYFI